MRAQLCCRCILLFNTNIRQTGCHLRGKMSWICMCTQLPYHLYKSCLSVSLCLPSPNTQFLSVSFEGCSLLVWTQWELCSHSPHSVERFVGGCWSPPGLPSVSDLVLGFQKPKDYVGAFGEWRGFAALLGAWPSACTGKVRSWVRSVLWWGSEPQNLRPGSMSFASSSSWSRCLQDAPLRDVPGTSIWTKATGYAQDWRNDISQLQNLEGVPWGPPGGAGGIVSEKKARNAVLGLLPRRPNFGKAMDGWMA